MKKLVALPNPSNDEIISQLEYLLTAAKEGRINRIVTVVEEKGHLSDNSYVTRWSGQGNLATSLGMLEIAKYEILRDHEED